MVFTEIDSCGCPLQIYAEGLCVPEGALSMSLNSLSCMCDSTMARSAAVQARPENLAETSA